jgi:glycerol-3-phosphate acyltransferase PlsY
MPVWVWALIPVGYAAGMFPSAVLIGRMGGHDVYREGSGNPGASNVARLMGWRYGIIVLLLDAAKGALAAGLGLAVGGRGGAWALGVAALVGHIAPMFPRLKGGKGVATGAGVMLMLFPLVVLICTLLWVGVAKGLKKASLASLAVAIAFPPLALLLDALGVQECSWIEFGVLCVLAALVIARHANNVRRLLRGDELTLPSNRPAASANDDA